MIIVIAYFGRLVANCLELYVPDTHNCRPYYSNIKKVSSETFKWWLLVLQFEVCYKCESI